MKTKIERKAIRGHRNFEIDENGKVWDIRTNTKVKEYVNPAGFSYVVLDRRIHTVAYLMKSAFFPTDTNLCIRHKDGNRTNNRLSNLYTYFSGEETLNDKEEEKKFLIMEVDADTNEVIRFWDSLVVAANELKEDYDKLRNASQRGTAVNGRKFEVYNSTLDGIGLFDYTDGKHQVCIYDENGNHLKTVTTLAEAKRYTGESSSTIDTAITKHQTTKNGYRYKWKLSTVPEPVKEPKQTAPRSKISQYTLDGKLIHTFNSIIEAAKAFKLATPNTISNAVNGKTKSTLGFIWRKEGEPFNKHPLPQKLKLLHREIVRVDVYNTDGAFVGNYASISAAAKELGVNAGGLQKCLSGSAGRVGKYVARKEGEPFDKHQHSQPKVFYQLKPAEDGNGYIIVKEWPTIRAAAKELGYSESSLCSSAMYFRRNHRPFKDGYYYAYGSY